MAQIFVTNKKEAVQYEDDKARKLRADLMHKVISPNDYIQIEEWFGKASSIKSIVIEDEVITDVNKSNKQRKEYEKQWKEEQEILRAETPEKKAERCFYAYYITYFLLRVGYSNFLGKYWIEKGEHYVWETFPKLFKEKYPQVCTSLFSDMIKYFKDNATAVWCDATIYKKHLPEKSHHSLLFDGLK